ncbi:MAG: alpha/beta hydrolase [Leptolyngbyaceae cyanobacterium MO_188.B28]|nr:alpha/beta hydrolase [Leptolyngbyaceae cyanobacterium MO_188.B28]
MIPIRLLLLTITTAYQVIASWNEDRQSPPGQLIEVGDCNLHLQVMGEGSPTVVLEHSLGGIEGYFLIQDIAKLTRICIYDRAGYGWSEQSPQPRTSEQIVSELDTLLTQAGIDPPYLLVGDSFGSYNVRLYAHRFPEKVAGLVLTDGLHEAGMLEMPLQVQALKLFFMSGFVMSTLGSALGIVRLLRRIGVFELLKPELRQFHPSILNLVKRSFCRPKHWLTMFREMLNLDTSGRQLQVANQFDALPIVLITASSFFRRSLWTSAMPIPAANRLREKMHGEILKLSTDCVQIPADQSGHFVWIDQSEVILEAIEVILGKVGSEGKPSIDS